MQTTTSQKTTRSITHTMKVTEPAFGSDEYMAARGYRPATEEERQEASDFVNRPNVFRIAYWMIRQKLGYRPFTEQSVSSQHVTESPSPVSHQTASEVRTLQSAVTLKLAS
jgi:hypothetical protein